MKRLKPAALKVFAPAEWDLIPLHPYDSETFKHGRARKDGKRPRDSNWTTRDYTSSTTVKVCAKENRNVGVRLRGDQLVIDVDPRNGGDEGFANLCLDLGIDPDQFPRVITGSGGSHFYMRKPVDVPVLDTLEAYAGVEFKSKGRQVVAPGSIHPDTKRYYKWDRNNPSIAELPDAPLNLINVIRRPQRAAMTGGGQYSQEQIAKALDALDVLKFKQHDEWLKLMMACHHASNGDARQEFVEWSTRDPGYAKDADLIGRRWDSLHREKVDGVTYRTLNKLLRDHGAPDAQAAGKAADDFEDDLGDTETETETKGADDVDDSWLDVAEEKFSGLTDDAISALEALNEKYVFAIEGGKPRIIFKSYDPVQRRDSWARMTPADFAILHANRRIERDKEGLSKNAADTLPLGKAWIEWPGRKDVDGVIFDPSREWEGYLNLWTGFAVEPSPKGDWSILNDLIGEVLADGDTKVYEYILNWLAFLCQNPAQRAEVALVFKGGRGVGKGTLGNAVVHILGRHALSAASAELITGRFNSHLQDTLFLFADEAVKPFDRAAESRLKALITEPVLAFEGKGRDVISGPNYIHIMMASNESWVIPAGEDERRYLVSDVNDKWRGKFKRWQALSDQLKCEGDSGYRRMLFDLLTRPLPDGWHPRDVPHTKALLDQQIRSQSPLPQMFFDFCTEKVIHFDHWQGPWETAPVRFFYEDLRDYFTTWCKSRGINPTGRGSTRFLLRELQHIFRDANVRLRSVVPDDSVVTASKSDGRAQAIELPSLPDCRKAFEDRFGGKIDWSVKREFG